MKSNHLFYPENTPPKEVLNREEAAELLGCSLKFLGENTRKGMIPHRTLGRRIFYSRWRLIQWVQNKNDEEVAHVVSDQS